MMTANNESVEERRDRLGGTSTRLKQIDRLLLTLRGAPGDPERALAALRALTVDAILDADDTALTRQADGLNTVLSAWTAAGGGNEHHVGAAEDLHNVAQSALERIVPLAALAELGADSRAHEVLALIAAHPRCSNDDLVRETELDKSHISHIGRRLHNTGLARKVRVGTYNAWELTPRGRIALDAADGRPRPIPSQAQFA